MKYIRLLYPFAGAMPGTVMTIPDDQVEAAVKSGSVEIVGQEAKTKEIIVAPKPEPFSEPVLVTVPEKEPVKPVRAATKRGKK